MLDGSRPTPTVVDKMHHMKWFYMCWMVQGPTPLWLIKCRQCAYVPASDGPDHMTKSFNNSASVRGSYQGCVSYVWIASCKVHSGWFCTYKACFCSGRFASLAVHQFEIMCHKIRRVSLKWHSKLLHSGAEFAVQLNLQCSWASSRNLKQSSGNKSKAPETYSWKSTRLQMWPVYL